jgi:hypothetical protein
MQPPKTSGSGVLSGLAKRSALTPQASKFENRKKFYYTLT